MNASTWHLYALAPAECLKLYVVTEWGTVSPATQVTLVVPSSPTAPTPGALTWDPESYGFMFSWTPPDDFTSIRAMRNFDDPNTCPTTYDEDQADWLGQDFTTHKWLLPAYSASECVSLFAVTNWGTVSPRTQIDTQVPAPTATPTVGPVGPWPTDPSYVASATVTLTPGPSYYLGIEVVPGTCPALPAGNAGWYDGAEDWTDSSLWYFYPEPYGDTGQQCVMFAAVDTFGQHGPVVKRQFTVPGG